MSKKIHELDVVTVIHRFSGIVCDHAYEMFSLDLSNECFDLGLESPIEKIFYAAFRTVAQVNGLSDRSSRTCEINPQMVIGKYRADFVVSYVDWSEQATFKKAVVECDGHNFHDRSEQERRYEKQRDRWMQMQGWQVFRFTGKEIKDSPIKVASEVISFLTSQSAEDLQGCVDLFDTEGTD